LASWSGFGSVPSLSISWKSLRSIGARSVSENLSVNPSGPGSTLFRDFITALISMLFVRPF
jgi:hypothetical protein